MSKTEKKMAQAAQRYSNRWEAMSNKKSESQAFWPEWHKTHLNNDLAIVAASNSPNATAEPECVARLFTLYYKLTYQS